MELWLHDGSTYAPERARQAWHALRDEPRTQYTDEQGIRSWHGRSAELHQVVNMGAHRLDAILAGMVDESVVRHILTNRAEALAFVLAAHDLDDGLTRFAHARADEAHGRVILSDSGCAMCLALADALGLPR